MRRPLAVTTLLLALLLAACGGDDGAQVALSEPAVTESATEEATSAPEPEPTEAPTAAEEPAAPAPTPAPDPDDADTDDADADDADTDEDAGAGDDADDPAATTFELSLNGDGVDGGCSWGVDEDERFYEIVYPEGMAVVGSPVTLIDGDGDVIATEGGGMRVTGTLAPDQTPSCDVGTVLVADAVEPL